LEHTLLANLSRKEERAKTTASKKNSQLINTFRVFVQMLGFCFMQSSSKRYSLLHCF